MKLILQREERTTESTISKLFIDGVFQCYILEDVDRGLHSNTPLAAIQRNKVFGKTAIPYGTYQVIISFSTRFQKLLPLLIGVPGFEGIRMHSGNTALDTEGCLLTGTVKATNQVLNSRLALAPVMAKLTEALKKETVSITIQ